MKTILALFTALVMGSAMADHHEGHTGTTGTSGGVGPATTSATHGTRHMVEFSAEDLLEATLGFTRGKARQTNADNDTQLNLSLNYAYSLPMHERLQLGGKVRYNKANTAGSGDQEGYGFDVGAIYNFSGWNRTDPVDLTNSAYLSAFVGLGWTQIYTGDRSGDDEASRAELALGKRWDLRRWGVDHVSFSPEVALSTTNSTTNRSLGYTQGIEFRLLQFAVFW